MEEYNIIHVIIVEDDIDIRSILTARLNKDPEIKVIKSFHNVETALETILKKPPEVILMDISLPGISGIEGVKLLKRKKVTSEIIMLTIHQEDELVFEALCAGACGYLTKFTTPQKIGDAIKEAMAGGAPMSSNIARIVVSSFNKEDINALSPRENDVLSELCKGKSYRSVADALYISEHTVRNHIRNIYNKLEVNSKAEAVALAIKNKLV